MSMDQVNRLTSGGRINRGRRLRFTFNQQTYEGYEGDTLASALLANGIQVVGRGIKCRRPRGFVAAGAQEPNGLLNISQNGQNDITVRATLQPLYEGLVATSQDGRLSTDQDIVTSFNPGNNSLITNTDINELALSNRYRQSGIVTSALGEVFQPGNVVSIEPYCCDSIYCDVLVCGAGPAGLSATLAAFDRDANVLLVDQDFEVGGSFLSSDARIDGLPVQHWLDDIVPMLEFEDNLTVMTNTTVVGYIDRHVLLIVERCFDEQNPGRITHEKLWRVHAQEIILATGATEQPLVFPNNDRPGIMLASAVSQYLKRFAVRVGERVAVVTNNDSAYRTALDLSDAGIEVVGVVDSRAQCQSPLLGTVRGRGIIVYQNSLPIDTVGTDAVTGLQIGARDDSTETGFSRTQTIACDCVAMSGGWRPALKLFNARAGRLRYDDDHCAYLPQAVPDNMQVIGSASGTVSLTCVLLESYDAGLIAAQWYEDLGFATPVCTQDKITHLRTEPFTIKHKLHRQWVDFMQDVTQRDLVPDTPANGASQPPAAEVVSSFRALELPVVLAGIACNDDEATHTPVRRSPLHVCHQPLGAQFRDYGLSRRPAAYLHSDETITDAIPREVMAVRANVGIVDHCAQGKIAVCGNDAMQLVNRLYLNAVDRLEPGKACCGLMLNERGVVIDDGIVVCVHKHHFLLCTGSISVGFILGWINEWLKAEWKTLDVSVAAVTTQWASIGLHGPRAWDVLQQLPDAHGFSGPAPAPMTFCEGTVADIPVRLLSTGLVNEQGFEISIGADYGAALWHKLMEAGKPFQITPVGVESMRVLHIESGKVQIGVDTDDTTLPFDLATGADFAERDDDFIGKQALSYHRADKKVDRLQLVGLLPGTPCLSVSAGAQVLNEGNTGAPAPSQGYVSSACYSPSLSRWIALGAVRDGHERLGETVNLVCQGQVQPATIVDPVFYNPEGE